MKIILLQLILAFEVVLIPCCAFILIKNVVSWPDMDGWDKLRNIFYVSPIMIMVPLFLFIGPLGWIGYSDNPAENPYARELKLRYRLAYALLGAGALNLLVSVTG
jgi:hypothetical protein